MKNKIGNRKLKIGNEFTLIELLVVISIIAILAALLLPALKSAKDISKDSVCKSNLKQVGILTFNYLMDYNEMFPSEGDKTASPYFFDGTNQFYHTRSPLNRIAYYGDPNVTLVGTYYWLTVSYMRAGMWTCPSYLDIAGKLGTGLSTADGGFPCTVWSE